MEGHGQEKPKIFPEWVRDPDYLPTIDDLRTLHSQQLWDDFVHHNPLGSQFQIYTKEFVDSFAKFITDKIKEQTKKEIAIMDVGAGNGRLTHFLEETIGNQIKDKIIKFSAIDDLSWDNKISSSGGSPFWIQKNFKVEELSIEEALKNDPDIVVCSWMPKDEDWTKFFKENINIKIFIMIGEENECGTESSWQPDKDFIRVDVAVDGNVCWSDLYPGRSNSKVAAFIRKSKSEK